jgi:hypothetical protein
MRAILAVTLWVIAAGVGHAQMAPAPSPSPSAAAAPAPRDETLPAAEETAKAALEKSPRHGEYVDGRSRRAARPSGPGSSIPSARARPAW